MFYGYYRGRTMSLEPGMAVQGTFDLPVVLPEGGSVAVALRLVGASSHTHTVDARLNGWSLGSVTFEGF